MTKVSIEKMFRLDGKAALITGGAAGIGASICERFGEAGAHVICADIDLAQADAVVQRLRKAGFNAESASCDISKVSEIDRLVHYANEKAGGVDILVNNAGIFPMAPALSIDETLWDKTLNTNLRGAFFLAQRVAQLLISQKRSGAIVNIASIDAVHPTGALAHYDASKGALMSLTKSLALELAPWHIRVNSIAPGGIETPGASAAMKGDAQPNLRETFISRIPMKRMGTPDEIAMAALYLCSPAATYTTGEMLVVDGGYLLS